MKASLTVSSKIHLPGKNHFFKSMVVTEVFPLVGSDMGLEDTIEGFRSWGPETGSRVGWIGNQWSHPKWGI